MFGIVGWIVIVIVDWWCGFIYSRNCVQKSVSRSLTTATLTCRAHIRNCYVGTHLVLHNVLALLVVIASVYDRR